MFVRERDSWNMKEKKKRRKLRYHNEAETRARRIDLRKINRNKELYLVFLRDLESSEYQSCNLS